MEDEILKEKDFLQEKAVFLDEKEVKKEEVSREEISDYMVRMQELISEGQGKGGFLTQSDIERHIPLENWNTEILDNMISRLQDSGIEIVDDDKELASPTAPWWWPWTTICSPRPHLTWR